jgi:anti-sigma B factor antagonist
VKLWTRRPSVDATGSVRAPGSTLTVELHWTAPAQPVGGPAGDLLAVVTGELDVATEPLLVDLVTMAAAGRTPAQLHLDLAGVRFVDARGVGAILGCGKLAEAAGAGFALVRASHPVREVLHMVDLGHLLPPPEAREPRRPATRPARPTEP